MTAQTPGAMALLPRDTLGADSESFAIGERALQAPPTVCLQYGDVSGNHDVVLTKGLRDAIANLFDRNRSQIWFHNGPFDIACFLEWYPELADLIWLALREGRLFDTMYLQRMAQIARGEIGGPLGLDAVTPLFGLRPPTKKIEAVVPEGHPWAIAGTPVDVRTSFGLFYNADRIPEPWYGYADYDGEIMLPLAARMVERYCTPKPGSAMPLVRLEDLAQTVQTYVGHHLWRTYGLKVNPAAVSDLGAAARAAMHRLQDAARTNGFLKPAAATRKDVEAAKAAGYDPARAKFCPVRYESRPEQPGVKRDRWDKRAAKHVGCTGCKLQQIDTETGDLVWKKDTKALMAAVTRAYEGNPPLTEAKKDKKTGKMKGGGKVAISRHVLQDSQNHELEAWSQYNEYVTLLAKDMAIFARGVVHTRIGIANTLRITSSDPNTLNFRRNSFNFATCPVCEYEVSLDADTAGKLAKKKLTMFCPHCEPEEARHATATV